MIDALQSPFGSKTNISEHWLPNKMTWHVSSQGERISMCCNHTLTFLSNGKSLSSPYFNILALSVPSHYELAVWKSSWNHHTCFPTLCSSFFAFHLEFRFAGPALVLFCHRGSGTFTSSLYIRQRRSSLFAATEMC